MFSVSMLFHILAGSIALLSGAVAMTARKGGPWHAAAGTWFFGSMLAMAGSGAAIAALKPERGTMMIGIFTCYLVTTSWMTARRRDGRAGTAERLGLVAALLCAATLLAFGLLARAAADGRMDSLPAVPHFLFGGVALIAAFYDASFLRRGTLTSSQRIGRHLWRMGAAMLIATTSFFFGQADEFPAALRATRLHYVPPILVVGTMIFWIFAARFGRRFGPRRTVVAGGAS